MSSIKSKDTITQIFEIITSLILKEEFSILNSNTESSILSLYSILPYLWGKQNSNEIIYQLSEIYSKNLSNENIKSLFYALLTIPRQSNFLIDLSKTLFNQINESNLKLILHFYIEISQRGTNIQKEAVYCLCGDFMSHYPPDKQLPEFATLAYYAVTEQTTNISDTILIFIRDLVKTSSNVQKPTIQQPSKFISLFPKLNFYLLNEIINYSPNIIDVFQSLNTLPPIFLTDTTFINGEFKKEYKRNIEKIHSIPFTEWYQTLFQAQLQSSSEFEDNINFNLNQNLDIITIFTEIKNELFNLNLNDSIKNNIENYLDDPGFIPISIENFFPNLIEINNFGENELINNNIQLKL